MPTIVTWRYSFNIVPIGTYIIMCLNHIGWFDEHIYKIMSLNVNQYKSYLCLYILF